MTKRLKHGLILAAILGLFCVVGAYLRSDEMVELSFVLSLWYNRLLIGLVIGAPWPMKSRLPSLVRGGLLGMVISFAFFISHSFKDPISFIAGIVYGMIIEEYYQRKRL